MKKTASILFFLLAQSTFVHAAIISQAVSYKQGEVFLEGYLAYDDSETQPRPGILVVHEWKGLGDYAKRRANQLVELGYVAFAADMYGKDIRPESHEEAAKQSGIYKSDRALMRARIQSAVEVLKSHPLVNPNKIAAIGYCFGGTSVLELARSGVAIQGVVSFHGGLATPNPKDAKNIKTKILVCHGADDKYVGPEVEAFKKEMSDAGVDFRFESYPGAVHSFTVLEAGNDPSQGMAYNEAADRKSWEAMKVFFQEIFR